MDISRPPEYFIACYTVLMRPNKVETTVYGCKCWLQFELYHVIAPLSPVKLLTQYQPCIIAIFVHSYLHGNLPSVFKDYFSTNDTIVTYNTRSSRKLHISYKRTNYGKFSIKYKGAQIWNSLPTILRDINQNIFLGKKSSNLFNKNMIFT